MTRDQARSCGIGWAETRLREWTPVEANKAPKKWPWTSLDAMALVPDHGNAIPRRELADLVNEAAKVRYERTEFQSRINEKARLGLNESLFGDEELNDPRRRYEE